MDEVFEHPSAAYAETLGPDEKLLWSGVPRQGIFLKSSDMMMIPFSLMWGGFAIFWETMAVSTIFKNTAHPAPLAVRIIFPLWGVPFVAVGLYMIAGRFFADKWKRSRTLYTVTNQRVIIRSGLFRLESKSLNLRTLPELSLTETSEGRGTITFAPEIMVGRSRSLPPMFEEIPDARRVYEIIRKAQAAA